MPDPVVVPSPAPSTPATTPVLESAPANSTSATAPESTGEAGSQGANVSTQNSSESSPAPQVPPKKTALEKARERSAAAIEAATKAEQAKRQPPEQQDDLTKFRSLVDTDPLEALKVLGLNPDEFLSKGAAQLLGLEPEQKEEPSQQDKDIAELKAWKAEQKRLADEQKAASEVQQQVAEFRQLVKDEFAQIADAYPLTAKNGGPDLVRELMLARFQTFGESITPRQAAKYLEKQLAKGDGKAQEQASTPTGETKPKSQVAAPAQDYSDEELAAMEPDKRWEVLRRMVSNQQL